MSGKAREDGIFTSTCAKEPGLSQKFSVLRRDFGGGGHEARFRVGRAGDQRNLARVFFARSP